MFINDGNGNGNGPAGVTANRLLTESKSRPSEEVEADQGMSFIAHGVCHTAAAAAGGLMSIENKTSGQEIVITRIYIDPQTLTPTDLLLVQAANSGSEITLTSGTDISTTGVIQKNTGKGKWTASLGEVKISDGSANLTYTGGSQFHEFPVTSRASTQRDMKGTNVIAPGGIWLMGWKTEGGGNATDAEKVSLSVNFFLRDQS